MVKIKEKTLTRFIKDNCANYDIHYQKCLFADSCRVMDGLRCGYFEKCVLGPADYKYRLPGYDYSKLFAQYANQTGTAPTKVKQRRCECGEPLQRGRRFCNVCNRKRRKESYRNSKRSKRMSVHS